MKVPGLRQAIHLKGFFAPKVAALINRRKEGYFITPSGDKPIYCKACFGGKPGNGPAPRTENYAEQFKALNAKLDALIKVLVPVTTIPLAAKAEKKAEKPAEVKSASAKAPVDKPVVEVKPAAKKVEKVEKPAKAEKKVEKKAPAKKDKK